MESKKIEKRTTFSVGFVCRPSKCDRKGLAPIEMTISLMGSRMILSLPNKVSPEEFRKCMGMKKNSPVRLYCQKMEEMVSACMPDMVGLSVSDSLILLKRKVRGEDAESTNIRYHIGKYLELLSKRVGVSLTVGNFRKYEKVLGYLCDECGDESEVRSSSVMAVKALLESKYEGSTVANYLTKLKSFIIYLSDEGIISTNPFRGVKISKKMKDVEFLTEDEVHRIQDMNCHGIDRIERVRDLFIFQCHTALSYADMVSVHMNDLIECEYGYYIRKERQKTGVIFTTLIDEVAYGILQKYDGVLPVLSNQKFNLYLKEIADLCGITKPMHSHIARHTCATMMLNRGMSLESVAKVLGHSSTRITAHYGKMLDRTVLREMAQVASV